MTLLIVIIPTIIVVIIIMTNSFKDVSDKLLDVLSESNLNAIALKVAAKYNDDNISKDLAIEPPELKDSPSKSLFENSDRAFIESFLPNNIDSAIADDVAVEIVEGFNA